MDEMNKPASRVEAILQRMLGADVNIEKPASRVEFLLSNVKDLLLAVEDEVEKLEGKTTRLLYSDKTNPTAQEIDAFAIEKGYESPYEGVAVVVASTYHIWHFYENDNIGWRDDGVDTITPFTNLVPGSILGSTDDGKIGANQDGTGSVNGLPVIKSVGRSSVKTITENIEGDVDRTNIVKAPFAVAFGSRNSIGSTASESGAFGGKIRIGNYEESWENYGDGENAIGIGYDLFITGNQACGIGYKIQNHGNESFASGNNITLKGGVRKYSSEGPENWIENPAKYCTIFGKDITLREYNGGTNPSSSQLQNYSKGCLIAGENINVNYKARHTLIFGYNHNIDNANQCNAIFGEGMIVGSNFHHSILSGNSHTIGNDVEFVNIFGGTDNILNDYLTDCTIFGYTNHIYGGSSSSNKVANVYILGDNNSNSKDDTTNNAKSKVFLFGNHLKPLEDGQFIVGQYNKISSNKQPDAWFVVGSGSSENHRRTSFAVCYNNDYGHHIYVGEKRLQEPTANGHIATEEYVGDIVGDIDSVLDTINGTVI